MKRIVFVLLLIQPFLTNAQQVFNFPQKTINDLLEQGSRQSFNKDKDMIPDSKSQTQNFSGGIRQFLDKYSQQNVASRIPLPTTTATGDTLIVGALINDTVRITGTYLQKGPIFIVNDGVLIIHNATATILGDIDAWGNGKVIADSSSLYFPQQYFYQRGIVSAGNSSLQFTDCSFNYGGISHNMALLDSSEIVLTRVHQSDWATIGTFGKPTFIINGTNQAGEIIISGGAQIHIRNADTLLPWYQMPKGSIINTAFPNGDSVQHYDFYSGITGISGIDYTVTIDTCKSVWWGMMPVDGSDVTISNSVIRAIGLWFTGTDTVAVSGLVDNSSYGSFTASLTDRTLKINNSTVTTWSLYPMDNSHVDVTGCIVGEIGAGGQSSVTTNKIFVDGSGGYFWASGTGLSFAISTAFTSNVRSEQSGFVVVAYCTVSQGAVAGISNSLLIAVQTTSSQPPVALDGSVVWDANIAGPTTGYVDSVVQINGSAWIDRGPVSVNPMDFGNYQVFYQPSGSLVWTPVNSIRTTEVHENQLAVWNTHGLPAGNYNLMLTLKNNSVDSVNAVTSINLLPAILLGVDESLKNEIEIFPNPANNELRVMTNELNGEVSFTINNIMGERLASLKSNPRDRRTFIDLSLLNDGIYILQMHTPTKTYNKRFVIAH